jgi:hypothetical protein
MDTARPGVSKWKILNRTGFGLSVPTTQAQRPLATVTLGGKETVSKSKTKKSEKQASGSLKRAGYASSSINLRDYFAARALQMIVINDVSGRPDNFRDHYAKGAYEWADAMLRARHNK